MTYTLLEEQSCRFSRFFVTWAVVVIHIFGTLVLLYVIFRERTTEANSGGERLNLLLPPFIFGVCERGFGSDSKGDMVTILDK